MSVFFRDSHGLRSKSLFLFSFKVPATFSGLDTNRKQFLPYVNVFHLKTNQPNTWNTMLTSRTRKLCSNFFFYWPWEHENIVDEKTFREIWGHLFWLAKLSGEPQLPSEITDLQIILENSHINFCWNQECKKSLKKSDYSCHFPQP